MDERDLTEEFYIAFAQARTKQMCNSWRDTILYRNICVKLYLGVSTSASAPIFLRRLFALPTSSLPLCASIRFQISFVSVDALKSVRLLSPSGPKDLLRFACPNPHTVKTLGYVSKV
eukprot:2291476-Pleurochrysis_carterae.AAC.1